MIQTDYVSLSTVPADEPCVQVDPKVDYLPAMKAEASKYKELLKQAFPHDDSIFAYFRLARACHEFGAYYEVELVYQETCSKSAEFAFWVESNLPKTWVELEAMAKNGQAQWQEFLKVIA